MLHPQLSLLRSSSVSYSEVYLFSFSTSTQYNSLKTCIFFLQKICFTSLDVKFSFRSSFFCYSFPALNIHASFAIPAFFIPSPLIIARSLLALLYHSLFIVWCAIIIMGTRYPIFNILINMKFLSLSAHAFDMCFNSISIVFPK